MDLNIVPLARTNEQEQQAFPGLHIAPQPKRTARSRQQDRLILYFVMMGNSPLSPNQQDQLLTRLSKAYYKTSGSVTGAMRTVAEALNQYLLDRNVRSASSGLQTIGLLCTTVVRDERIYLAQSGPIHAFLIQAAGVQHFHDAQSSNRGLGLGRTTPIHYFQSSYQPDDSLLLAAEPPLAWNVNSLKGLHNQGVESLRRLLMNQAGPELNAVLIKARTGAEKTYLVRPKPSAPSSAAPPETAEPSPVKSSIPLEAQAPADEPVPAEAAVNEAELPSKATVDSPEKPAETLSTARQGAVSPPAPRKPPQPETSGQSADQVPGRKGVSLAPLFKILATIARALGTTLGGFALSLRSLLKRMLPGEGIFTLPSSVMVFTAVAVPLVVVAIATVIYFQRGRTDQFNANLAEAQKAAQEAKAQTTPQTQRIAWQAVIEYLDKADSISLGPTSQSIELRVQAQSVLDNLDGVRRLNYQTAVADAPNSYNFTRMAATEDNDLYLLNSNGGNVWRTFSVGRGYEMDDAFQCGPTTVDSMAVGPLIDIAPLPKGNDLGASILGMDTNGHVLLCSPGEKPQAIPLAPPSSNWIGPKAIAFDLGNFYVLDPQANAVWVYWNEKFTEQPELYFSENVPPMQDVIDLTVDKTDLYLLHADGHITLCTYSELGVSPTRCTDPAPYLDSRPGRENLPLIPEAAFTEIISTQPPDPSLYLLQPDSRAIFHFSLRLLTFQRQLRPQIIPQNDLPEGPATAFTLSPDSRTAFIALGNHVYYAGMP
jgi:hypothetical protein